MRPRPGIFPHSGFPKVLQWRVLLPFLLMAYPLAALGEDVEQGREAD
jgi:hypothetical protein